MQRCGLPVADRAKFLGGNARRLYKIQSPRTFIRERVTEIERPDWWPTEAEVQASLDPQTSPSPSIPRLSPKMATLIVFSGLPASGKSSIARALAEEICAIWLRIDSIEQAIRGSGVVPGSLEDAGYRAAYAVAEDNLRLGHDVIGDSVNPWMLTRNEWRAVGTRADARVVEVETVCSDRAEHRRRVESRASEVPGLILPDWQAVIGRDYHPWDRDHVTIDTAKLSLSAAVELIRAAI